MAKHAKITKVKLAPGNGGVKLIKFGDEYKGWADRRKINYLEKLASTMNHAADVMQKERDRAYAFAANAEQQLKAAALQRTIQEQTMASQLGRNNERIQSVLEENEALKKRVREVVSGTGD